MRRAARLCLALAVAGVALAACVSAPRHPSRGPAGGTARPLPTPRYRAPVDHGAPRPVEDRPAGAAPSRTVSFADLPGWGAEDHAEALQAWRAACARARDADYRPACAAARDVEARTPGEARRYFERWFTPVAVRTADGAPGLLTAYFAPEYPARDRPDAAFSAPVLARPTDLVRRSSPDGRPRWTATDGTPYADRAAIEGSVDPGQVLAWMRPEDLFFLQIQGSGYLDFGDGHRAHAAYSADNGRPFVGIARAMSDRGLLSRDATSGEAIRNWLAGHRGPEAAEIMALNPRYVFFALEADDGGQPRGAAGVPLAPGRAIAVDTAHWRLGDLVWLQADAGTLIGARRGYRGLVVALDTGGAIRGPVRADLFLGRGPAAGVEAGTVRHPLFLWRLTPRSAPAAAAER